MVLLSAKPAEGESKAKRPLCNEDSEFLILIEDEAWPEGWRPPKLSREEKVRLEAVRTLESKSPNIFTRAVGVLELSSMFFKCLMLQKKIRDFNRSLP